MDSPSLLPTIRSSCAASLALALALLLNTLLSLDTGMSTTTLDSKIGLDADIKFGGLKLPPLLSSLDHTQYLY